MIKDYQIFKETIKNIIQNSELNIGIVYFVLKDIYSDIEKMYYLQLNKELAEEQQKNTEHKDELETTN